VEGVDSFKRFNPARTNAASSATLLRAAKAPHQSASALQAQPQRSRAPAPSRTYARARSAPFARSDSTRRLKTALRANAFDNVPSAITRLR